MCSRTVHFGHIICIVCIIIHASQTHTANLLPLPDHVLGIMLPATESPHTYNQMKLLALREQCPKQQIPLGTLHALRNLGIWYKPKTVTHMGYKIKRPESATTPNNKESSVPRRPKRTVKIALINTCYIRNKTADINDYITASHTIILHTNCIHVVYIRIDAVAQKGIPLNNHCITQYKATHTTV